MKRFVAVLIAVTLTVLVFGSVASASTPAAKQLVAADAKLASAEATFSAADSALGSDPSSQQVAQVCVPIDAALRQFVGTLNSIRWPANARAQARLYAANVAVLAGVLSAASVQNLFSAGTWITTIAVDSAKVKQAGAVLRRDMGVPAPG